MSNDTPKINIAKGFLTAEDIKKNYTEFFCENEFNAKCAERASYDFRLGDEVFISGQENPIKLTDANPFVCIPRGQFAILMTYEFLKVPLNYLAFISIKFSIKKLGIINISGFHVDPGWNGKIMFSVFNAGPNDVVLRYKQRVFMIFFYELYQAISPPKDKINYEGSKDLPVDIVTSAKGTSASLSDVDKRVRDLEATNRVYIGFLIALAVGLAVAIIKSFFPG